MNPRSPRLRVPALATLMVLAFSGCAQGAGGDCPEDVSYDGFAAPLFQESCRGCHDSSLTGTDREGAPLGVNFDTEGDILRHADLIATMTGELGLMPPGAPLDACTQQRLGAYLDTLLAGACVPGCSGRACGDDGCGGDCGTCAATDTCDPVGGQCQPPICTPSCAGRHCGDDGCGGSCGTCGTRLACSVDGQCACAPDCTGLACGDDGCGGSCGTCTGQELCTRDQLCVCQPDCTGVQCGSDGCAGTCGTCAPGDTCNAGTCQCVPDCTGRQCGPDGCGGTCGTGCAGALSCNTRTGKCVAVCTPDCTGRVCGDDGCGGVCGTDGTCPAGETCTATGTCACTPDCVGKVCGDDGCGGVCGTCPTGTCSASGQCECVPDCTGRVCGDDGCGGTCGSGCAAGELCSTAGQCGCAPDCSGVECGDDGCGGTCGGCASGATCDAGTCTWPAVSFKNDIYPKMQSQTQGCQGELGAGCHAGIRPAQDLDLSSAATAYAQLVGVASTQCTGRTRVIPGDPGSSYIISKLTFTNVCFGTQMPKGLTPWSAADIDLVRAWIGNGAPNN